MVAFFAAVPVTLTAIAGLIATLRKLDSVASKTDAIHTLANNNNQRLTTQLEVANERVAKLEAMVATLIEKMSSGKA